MNNELISIVVPIYGVEKYLERCIESIRNQTYENIEIILVDDGSKDNCPKICDDYKKIDKRIIVIHKENGGLSDARNRGIDVAMGEYITFIDSDDYVEKDYIECLYNTIKVDDADISICSYQAVYDNGTVLKQAEKKKYLLNSEAALEKMLYQDEFTVSAWAKLYKKSLFDCVRFPKGKIFEDAFTTYKLVDRANRVAVNLEIKYHYMIRGDSILTSSFSRDKLLLIDAYKQMGNFIIQKYPNLEAAIIRANVYAHISTLRQMIFANERLLKEEKEFRKYIKIHRNSILKNKKCSVRDKIAVILICINNEIFKLFWLGYCRITGRMYN